MSTAPASGASAASTQAPPKRLLRNYLLNPRFQLKYTAMICMVAVVLMTGLSVVIARIADTASSQASIAVSQAESAFRESKTSAEIIHTNALMNAGDNPELVARINADLRRDNDRLEASLAESRTQRASIEQNRKNIRFVLGGAGLLLVLLLGLAGIVITHRLVGPVFKLKRLLRVVGSGKLDIKERLRKGDELEDLFEVFLSMVASLRQTQTEEIAQLDEALKDADASKLAPQTIEKLHALRKRMHDSLGTDAP
jgi:nitrogen fixation/metabolism regulation signal transduction histidine kinase